MNLQAFKSEIFDEEIPMDSIIIIEDLENDTFLKVEGVRIIKEKIKGKWITKILFQTNNEEHE